MLCMLHLARHSPSGHEGTKVLKILLYSDYLNAELKYLASRHIYMANKELDIKNKVNISEVKT